MPAEAARQAASQVMADPQIALQEKAREELGISPELGSPLREEVAAAVKAQNVGVATNAPAAEDDASFGDFLKCVATNDVRRLRAVYKSSKALEDRKSVV